MPCPSSKHNGSRADLNAITCDRCENKQCVEEESYSDGSDYLTRLWLDQVRFGTPTDEVASTAIFGEIYEFTGPDDMDFGADVDGIIGFAFKALAESDAPTPFKDLVNAKIVPNVFSMCLTKTGGYMVLGSDGSDLLELRTAYKYTPITHEEYYAVNMLDVLVDGHSIGVPSKAYGLTIVDSGTSDLALPRTAMKALLNKLKELKLEELYGLYESCVPITESVLATLPQLSVVLQPAASNGSDAPVIIDIAPKNYLCGHGDLCGCDVGTYTLNIDSQSDSDGTILGVNVFFEHMVVYDRERRKIGFALTKDCKQQSSSDGSIETVRILRPRRQVTAVIITGITFVAALSVGVHIGYIFSHKRRKQRVNEEDESLRASLVRA